MNRLLITCALLLMATASCGQTDDEAAAAGRLDAAIDQAEDEAEMHGSHCLSAKQMDAVMSELERHEREMARIMDQMRGAMGRMSHCSGQGMGMMGSHMSDLDGYMSKHRARLEAAEELADGHDECEEHVGALSMTLGKMQGALPMIGCMNGGMH